MNGQCDEVVRSNADERVRSDRPAARRAELRVEDRLAGGVGEIDADQEAAGRRSAGFQKRSTVQTAAIVLGVGRWSS